MKSSLREIARRAVRKLRAVSSPVVLRAKWIWPQRTPRFLDDRKLERRVKNAFDAFFYLRNNEDIANAGIDPYRHYMESGWKEQRDPNSKLNVRSYLAENPEILRDGINPLVHWVEHSTQDETAENLSGDNIPNPRIDFPEFGQTYTDDELSFAAPFFDEDYYVENNPSIDFSNISPLEHYMCWGWLEKRDPSPDFSTAYYLDSNPEISRARLNPLLHYSRHGRREKRDPAPYHIKRARSYRPLVSVIVPNYNHARFLEERLTSIFKQTYVNAELILLDDRSSDDSVEVLDRLAEQAPFSVKKIYNRKNSGNAFAQWERGLEAADGELIWICESDDSCDEHFLERIVHHFADRSVQIAFGKIEFWDAEGNHLAGMDGFRERAEPGIWEKTVKRPAREWFRGALGVSNVIANVGGCVFRKQNIPQSVWDEAKRYRIAGDWYLYSKLAGGGQIVYEPKAAAFFRQHGQNESASNFDKRHYYQEYKWILENNTALWGLPAETYQRFIESIRSQWNHYRMGRKLGGFDSFFETGTPVPETSDREHIIMGILGFLPGGGELFPIQLANTMVAEGKRVSVLAFSMNEINSDILSMLDNRIAVYNCSPTVKRSPEEFLAAIGATLVHSHVINIDDVLLNREDQPDKIPYVVSLHGSYDSLPAGQDKLLLRIMRGVTHWVYTADKNLKPFSGLPIDKSRFSKLPNAMPPDQRRFERTREELGIDDDTVVFTLVARGIRQKGWRASVEAFDRLSADHPELKTHLLLVGEGPKVDELSDRLEKTPNVTHLGFQSRINGLYRISDCAIVPTRFDGESFPLCIIQALQEGVPVVATDIGEIRHLLSHGDQAAGIVVPNIRNSQEFFDHLYEAMLKMTDSRARKKYAKDAAIIGERFDMNRVADSYFEVYETATQRVTSKLTPSETDVPVKA